MERLHRLRAVILSTAIMLFLSCTLVGCSTVEVSRTDNRQLLLDVPQELLEPVSPLLIIKQTASDNQNKQ